MAVLVVDKVGKADDSKTKDGKAEVGKAEDGKAEDRREKGQTANHMTESRYGIGEIVNHKAQEAGSPVEETGSKELPFVLAAILEVGELMLIAGAEVNRVENTIRLMGKAYGFQRVDVFTITSSIVVTVHGQGEIITQTRRIIGYETDMWKIERCNELSRSVCKEPLSLAQLDGRIEEIRRGKRYPDLCLFLLYGGISGAFSIFFGGSLGDGAAAVVCGLLLWLELRIGRRLKIQNIVLTLLCSALIALGAVLLKGVGLAESVDKVIIGNIMLLIPGLAFTVSLRDMISGDMISGLLGLCEAVLRAVAIAAGVALALWRFGW